VSAHLTCTSPLERPQTSHTAFASPLTTAPPPSPACSCSSTLLTPARHSETAPSMALAASSLPTRSGGLAAGQRAGEWAGWLSCLPGDGGGAGVGQTAARVTQRCARAAPNPSRTLPAAAACLPRHTDMPAAVGCVAGAAPTSLCCCTGAAPPRPSVARGASRGRTSRPVVAQATAAPAASAPAAAAPSAVDTRKTPRQLGFTMPGARVGGCGWRGGGLRGCGVHVAMPLPALVTANTNAHH
jgi:hypothetical protein